MLNWVHVWTPSWPVHDLNILLVQKGCRVTRCMGRGIVLNVHKVASKHPRRNTRFLRIWMYRCRVMAASTTTNSLLPPMGGCNPYHDWRAMISIIGLDAGINQHLPLHTAHPGRPSLCYREKRDSSLKKQCLHCLRSHTLCLLPHSRRRRLCSKVSLGHLAGHRDQYPAARSRLQIVRTNIGGSSAFANEESRWSGLFWPFGAVEGLPMAWRFSSNRHASSDVVSQSLGCVAKYCLCILETPPASWLLLAENCHLATIWKIAAVFALANFVAWSPVKVQRNINNLYRNPTLHKSIKVVMARETSLQVTTPELTFQSLESQRSPDYTDCVWLFNLVM